MKLLEKYLKEILLFTTSFIISFYLASKFYGWVFVGVIPFPMKYPVIYGYNEFIPTSIILGIISVLVCWYLTRTYFLRKDKKSIWYFPYLAIVTSLFFHGLFFVIEMKYTFYEHPQWFMYMDGKGEYIENPERYFGLVEKYGFDGDTYRPFKTLDDAIQGLEFAKEKKNGMYGYIFRDLKNFGLLNVIQNIKDEDIYEDIMFEIIGVDYRNGEYNWEKESVEFFVKNLDVITYITQNTHNNKLKNVGMYVLEKYAKYQNGEIDDQGMFSKIYLESKEIYQN